MDVAKVIAFLVVVGVVVGMALLYFTRTPGPQQAPLRGNLEIATPLPPSPPTPSPASQLSPQGVTIEITNAGFLPGTVTVSSGVKVAFVNKDVARHWPASDVHPIHALCPGFDALRGLAQGETYSFTFTEKKGCPFHDHLKPSLRGTIKVQ